MDEDDAGPSGPTGPRLQELGWAQTHLGEITLRRRWDPRARQDVYEIKLDDDFLMSSLFTDGEMELARIGLKGLPGGPLDVVVGGLGLGYTAQTVLADARVRSMVVVEALEPVIDWHRRGLIPAGAALAGDPRCRLRHGDFFALAAGSGWDPEQPHRRFHAVIVDIDHSPRHLLHEHHAGFYHPDGLRRLAAHLQPGGVFALWSNEPPDPQFQAALAEVFTMVAAEVVEFANPLQHRQAANTVYTARVAGQV